MPIRNEDGSYRESIGDLVAPCSNRYFLEIAPLLDRVYDWYAEGFTDHTVAKKLRITVPTLRKYASLYPELRVARAEGMAAQAEEIEEALIKTAKGYHVDEIRKRTINKVDDEGNISTMEVIDETKRHIPADVRAQQFYLKNRKSTDWRDFKSMDVNGTVDFVVKLPDPPKEIVDQGAPVDTTFEIVKPTELEANTQNEVMVDGKVPEKVGL